MIAIIAQNGIVNNDLPDRPEITQQEPINNPPASPDSGQGDLSPNDQSSSTSHSEDSSEEKAPEQATASTGTDKKRTKFKTRSVSDSSDCSKEYRGILKYHGRRLRSLSESCAEQYHSSSHGCTEGESLSALDECWYEEEVEEEEDDEDGDDGPKVKKTVRFSEVVHKQLFRSNSSILGQRKKNQKKQSKKKKAASARSSPASTPPASNVQPSVDDDSDEDENDVDYAMSDAMDNVNLSDSGVEVNSDSDPCPDQMFSNSKAPATSGKGKANKKKHKKAQSRQRRASESNADMIFHLDL